ncbi:hypothetical protein BM477_01350 [Boudabousia marimammalium]|uniref:Hemagglutinin n=1 Tax=Boudabousia marimammalium TaxID=156892 RepID=A0A1Q5PTB3_9ACTO|nr:hypothetical protein BM477_01350 [Boudabousia marimammalium]
MGTVLVALLLWGMMSLISTVVSAFSGDEQQSTQMLPEPKTPPLSREGFDPGRIIDDKLFFRPGAMTEAQIKEFIETVGKGCRPGPEGVPCLADFTEDSGSFPADEFCPVGFQGASGDTAASIVKKAADACGLNPAVLLVTLQKEQGLLTASSDNLTPRRYQIAMGYACPDDQPCDPQFEGFTNQVYHAARQLARYSIEEGKYQFYAGKRSEVPYNANPSCGSGKVRIKNRATAALYNYTPHQPNAVTLAGGEDECTSWGNLNFYSYYLAWFGDPTP